MHIFISTFLILATTVIPASFTLAQGTNPTVPPPAIVGDHPNAVPPTKAPTKPLPVVSLDGTIATTTTFSAMESAIVSTKSAPQPTGSASSPVAAFVVGVIALAIIIRWFFWRRKY